MAMPPWLASIVLLMWLVLGAPLAPAAQEAGLSVLKRGAIAEDLYVAGGRVDVLAEVDGDVVAGGGRVAVGRRVTGDVMAAGGDVTITGDVLDDVRAAGGLVTLQARIAGDALVVGGSISVLPETVVMGKARLAGGAVEVRGRIDGSLRAAARTIRIGGEIRGDVALAAQEIEILPGARIAGSLTYRSPREARIDAAAQIGGTVTHHPIRIGDRIARLTGAIFWAARIVALLGLMLAGVVLVLMFPGFALASARTIRSDVWKSLGVGFALLVASPAAAGLLVLTGVGAPLGGALLALYFVALLAGFITTALFVGDLGVRLVGREPGRGGRVLAVVLGLIVVGLLRAIPIAGLVIVFAALVLGLGATGIHGYRAYARARP